MEFIPKTIQIQRMKFEAKTAVICVSTEYTNVKTKHFMELIHVSWNRSLPTDFSPKRPELSTFYVDFHSGLCKKDRSNLIKCNTYQKWIILAHHQQHSGVR